MYLHKLFSSPNSLNQRMATFKSICHKVLQEYLINLDFLVFIHSTLISHITFRHNGILYRHLISKGKLLYLNPQVTLL